MSIITAEDLDSSILPRNIQNSGIKSGNMLVNLALYVIYFGIFIIVTTIMLLLSRIPSLKERIEKKLKGIRK